MQKPPNELILPKWMNRNVVENKSNTILSKKIKQNELTNNKTIFRRNTINKCNEVNTDVQISHNDTDKLLSNFYDAFECGVQCEKLLDLADTSEELILGLELDLPSEYKAVLFKTSSIHICYGENLCIFFAVNALSKLPFVFTKLIQHPRVKLVGRNIIINLNKLGRDFNYNTKFVIENNVIREPKNINLYCVHEWSYKSLSDKDICTPIEPSVNEELELEFKGKIYYCINFNESAFLCEKLLILAESSTDYLILGFDLEWPVNKFGSGKVALMQICPNEEECYLFHLTNVISLPKVLLLLLKHPKVKLTGLNIANDIRKLGKDFKLDLQSISLNNIIELTSFANKTLKCFERWSLDRLVLNQLGVNLNKDKKVRISNWNDPNLSDSQLRYAATDAYASLLCYQHLNRLRANGD